MKAIGYARVSSTEQIEGTSLDNQATQIRAYCTMKGIELVDVLVDAGVSGGKPIASRPEGSKLVSMIESDEMEAVIICKLDRGFRSASDCLNSIESWEKKSISLHILNLGDQTIDTSSPTGKFFITVMAGAAELERSMINERCNEGRKARKAQDRVIGGTPFGYDVDAGNKLVANSQEMDAESLIRELNAAGYSNRQITAELNRQHVPTKKTGVWSNVQVGRILKRAA